MGSIGREKKVTYIDVDDDDEPDICILEDGPRPRRSAPATPPPVHHMGHNNNTNSPQSVDNEEDADESNVYRAALEDLSEPKLEEACAPEGSLKVPLMKHQRSALYWMMQKETKSMHCSGGFLADDQGLGKTISTIALMLSERSPSSSSVPTAQVEKEIFNLDDDDDNEQKAKTETNGSCTNTKSTPAAGTLIVCPTSVLHQWYDELQNKVSNKARLSVLMYHGANRTKDPSELAKYDVVLTTYPLVTMEVPKQPLVDESNENASESSHNGYAKKRKYPPKPNKVSKKRGMIFESLARPLAKVRWFRVVLDEAQTIKNHRTQVARACWGLKAKRRWCLSGTPIQNAIDDLYSYFRFLRYQPYAVYRSFCSTIKAPIQKCPEAGYKKLQIILKTIMLRRTKATLLDGKPIISLPPKTISLKQIDFTAEERRFYAELEAESKAQFKEYEAAGTIEQNYVSILLMLLRLRQACDHPLLVRRNSKSDDSISSLEKAKTLPHEKRTHLLDCLEASSAICSICSDSCEDPVVTTCGHVFCNQCILEHLFSDESCPSSNCKATLSTSSVFSASTLRSSLQDHQPSQSIDISAIMKEVKAEVKSEVLDEPCSSSSGSVNFKRQEAAEALESSKIKEAVEVLKSVVKPQEIGKVREKAIVFSQWTKMLDMVGACLDDSSIKYRRLDGTMSILDRDKAVKDFNNRPEVTVMIMSLKAASLGLNMVAASHVLLLDLWWNPTVEDQAIDRAHRIGQTRPVSVLRFTVKETVEDRILALQEKKRSMVASAFGEDGTRISRTRLTVDDLRYLFHF
uniref:LOW QUALITY PROTEIN: helicase-like transcription factor CHR28 n=1 Tax=Erigeron canadensis TaxID=72917 RepID=UPI001CB8E306|nr:LOW QUALITY PROTEIN: helicase-like transcription factor CHR28 [Erigeron canadensis]